MMDLKWSNVAKQDMQSIYDFIARDSVYYANEYTDKLFESAERLEEFPYSGRIVPEIGDENVREIIYGVYRLMYYIDERKNIVTVTQISHGSQQFTIHK